MSNGNSIEIICGPMFSGKTTTLISKIHSEIKQHKKVVIFKPHIDDRYSEDSIVSHDNNKIKCKTIKKSKEILNYMNDAEIFAIDECQLFDINIINVCKKLADYGKKIILAGLDNDYKAEPFEQMQGLMALTNNIIKLNAICVKCGKDANFSYRLTNETDIVVIGKDEKYEARCKKCYYNN